MKFLLSVLVLALSCTLLTATKQDTLTNNSIRQTVFRPRLIICLPGCGCQTGGGISVDCPFISVDSGAIVLRANRIAPGQFRAIRQLTISGEPAPPFQEGPPSCPVVRTTRPINDLSKAICTRIERPSPLPEAPLPPEPEDGVQFAPFAGFGFSNCRIRPRWETTPFRNFGISKIWRNEVRHNNYSYSPCSVWWIIKRRFPDRKVEQRNQVPSTHVRGLLWKHDHIFWTLGFFYRGKTMLGCFPIHLDVSRWFMSCKKEFSGSPVLAEQKTILHILFYPTILWRVRTNSAELRPSAGKHDQSEDAILVAKAARQLQANV